MNNISEHITYVEATKSQTALNLGILNVPSESNLERMRLLASKVFEPLRTYFGLKIGISSFYRCYELNCAIGGSKNSQHLAENGSAMDIDAEIFGGITNKEIFNYIKDNLIFDQLIAEFPDENGNPQWVHCSYNENNNRHNILISKKNDSGQTIYIAQN